VKLPSLGWLVIPCFLIKPCSFLNYGYCSPGVASELVCLKTYIIPKIFYFPKEISETILQFSFIKKCSLSFLAEISVSENNMICAKAAKVLS
jgi:hypothetical protein